MNRFLSNPLIPIGTATVCSTWI